MTDAKVPTEGENWVDAETDPKSAAAVAKQVDSDEWTFLRTLYYASCCDCGLTHRVDVRTVEGGYEVRHARMDDYTAEIRKQRDFPLSPRSSGGASERPCTCHPDDNPPTPCPRNYALQECRAAAEPAGGQWQPIETAPKDGKRVFVACPVRLAFDMVAAFWDDNKQAWINTPGLYPCRPSHWMRPSPPETKVDKP